MKKILMMAAFLAAGVASAAKVANVAVKDTAGENAGTSDVLARCQVKAGDEYDPAACARDVKALKDSGMFEEIKADAQHGATGIVVTYIVTRKSVFHGPLNVKGNTYWNAGRVAKFADLKDGYSYGESDFAAAAGRVRKEYQKKDFANVKVKPVVEKIPGSSGGVTVTMEIEEGARVKTHAWEFEGNETFEAADLRETFGQYPWWNPMGWFSDDPTSEQDYSDARDRVAAYYRDRGYLDVKVSMPEARPHDEDSVDRVFKIVEGPQYQVGAISVEGLKKTSPIEARAAAETVLRKGDIAAWAKLTEAAHAIEIYCGSGTNALAETHAQVRYLPTDDPKTVDLVFAVKEGHPVEIQDVVIRGNDYTKDKVIRREISLSPGDPMLENKAEQSKRRLENLRYFERVRYYLERVEGGTAARQGETDRRNLVYEVTEKNTGQFMVGIGASTVDSVYGTVELSESNFDLFSPWRFRGAGQKGRILAQAGPRYQSYEASVTEPHLFDRLLELTCEVYRRQRWYDEYDLIRNGAAITLAYPVKFWPTAKTTGRLGFRLSAEYIEFDDVDDDYWYLADEKEERDDERGRQLFKMEDDRYGDSVEVPLRIFWADDTRDSFLFPKKGHKTNIYGDVVGGDNEYWRLGFNYRQYFTVWKRYSHVFMFGIRGETVDAFSGHLPIYDRLFLGGPRSIRGVEYREISPRVWRHPNKKGHYAAWGGQTSWCVNMEYAVPVCKYVRVAAFSDLGSVAEDEFDFDTDYFCWSVGLGLRLDIEAFPIRLDFAVPVAEPDDDADRQVFSFTVGYDF